MIGRFPRVGGRRGITDILSQRTPDPAVRMTSTPAPTRLPESTIRIAQPNLKYKRGTGWRRCSSPAAPAEPPWWGGRGQKGVRLAARESCEEEVPDILFPPSRTGDALPWTLE